MQQVQKKMSIVKSPLKQKNGSPSKRSQRLAISDDDESDVQNETEAKEVANALDGGASGKTEEHSKKRDSSKTGIDVRKGRLAESHTADEEAQASVQEAADVNESLLKKWIKKASWEDDLKKVETMERAENHVLRVMVTL